MIDMQLIEAKVKEKYPRTELEKRGCILEIQLRQAAREAYKKKLIAQLEQEQTKHEQN